MKRTVLTMLMALIMYALGNIQAFAFQEAANATGQAGKKINFQGTLYENGEPVSGERNFTFSIALNDSQTWTETQNDVQVLEGLYAVVLGNVNPLPESLFYGAAERTLIVSIGNTVLGSTKLFAPFALADRKNFGYAEFKLEANEVKDSVALNAEIYGPGSGNFSVAVKGLAETDTTANTGVTGLAWGGEQNNNVQTGVRGYAWSNTDAWATGVWGFGYGEAGGVSYGLRGEAHGTGSTFSAAVRGLNNTEVVANGVRYGGYFNTFPSGNEGVLYEGRSIGAQGSATGSIQNIGVFGSAEGGEGTENWSGWFEGAPVTIREGNGLQLFGPENNLKADFNFFEPNNAGSLVTYGHNNTRRLILGSGQDGIGGFIGIYDSTDVSRISMRARYESAEWATDLRAFGQAEINGPTSRNIRFGAKPWEEEGTDRGAIQLFGSPVDDPNNEGNTTDMEAFFMSVDNQAGIQQGMLQFGKHDPENGFSTATLNYDNVSRLIDGIDSERYRLSVNEEDAGTLELFNSDNNQNVLVGSNGPKAGLVLLFDSLGREMNRLQANADGASYHEMSAALNADETRVTSQHWGGLLPWTNMIGRSQEDGSAIGRVQTGFLGEEAIPAFRITDTNFRSLVNLQADATNGARLELNGPTSTNFVLLGKDWENADLPLLELKGTIERTDENSNTYTPDLVALEVGAENGSEFGLLRLSTNTLTTLEAGVKSWETNGDKKPYLNLISDVEFSDGNGGTYNPALVNAEVNISDGNIYTGQINLSGSQEGHGIRMYGASDFNNDGSSIHSHIALDNPNGHIFLDGTGFGDFTGDVNAANFNQSSDARLKKNISTLTSGLAMINSLRGVRYNWKDEQKPENKVGFIAQEVEKVLPELVKTNKDGFKAINYAEMTAVLVEAVKELSAQIDDLKKENSQLKAEALKVESLEQRLLRIEALLGNSKASDTHQK